MAKSGFVPAWMKISSSDKSNGSPKLSIEQLYNKNRLLQKELPLTGQSHNRSEDIFAFQSPRSSSRDHLFKSLGTDKDTNNVSVKSNERRLNSISSFNHHDSISTNHRSTLTNENSSESSSNETQSDRMETDFPSLNGRELSSDNRDQSAIWKNASSKFSISKNEYTSFKHFDRSFGSTRQASRRDRLLSTPTTLNIHTRPIIHELQTNRITRTKRSDKRSDFLNSLKNDPTIEGDSTSSQSKTSSTKHAKTNNKSRSILVLSVSETSEEKELLREMGWNEDVTYEITNEDAEEYEKRMKLVPKMDDRSAILMLALNRRALPCMNIRDILVSEMLESTSDDDNSDD